MRDEQTPKDDCGEAKTGEVETPGGGGPVGIFWGGMCRPGLPIGPPV